MIWSGSGRTESLSSRKIFRKEYCPHGNHEENIHSEYMFAFFAAL